MNGPALIPLLILGFIAFAVVGGLLGHRSRVKRRDALSEWASSLGLGFRAERDTGFDERFAFRALQQGKNRYAYNIAEGDYEGRAVWAFDYHYETTSTTTTTDSKGRTRRKKQTHHHHFSAVIVTANVPLRRLVIRPEGWFDKVSSFFGRNDIDFESGQFSRRYHVSADDRKWAYDVLHARAIAMLLEAPTCTIEFDDGRHVLILTGGGTLTPEGFQASLTTVDTLLDMMPEYLRQQQRDTATLRDGRVTEA